MDDEKTKDIDMERDELNDRKFSKKKIIKFRIFIFIIYHRRR